MSVSSPVVSSSPAISANLGFLFADRALPEAIHAAKEAGFNAVELHWPYDVPALEIRQALKYTGLPLLGLNTRMGDPSKGEFGLCALPERKPEARHAIEEAVDYASITGARSIHVMAGKARGADARATMIENLRYAHELTEKTGTTLLIEPMNKHDVPGYHLPNCDEAASLIDQTRLERIAIMLDCYHLGRNGADILEAVTAHLPFIRHIQFAALPDRTEPDHGEIDYQTLLPIIRARGYDGAFGAEYRPSLAPQSPEAFAWLPKLKQAFTIS